MTVPPDGIMLRMEDPPPCPRCGGPGLLLARFPHRWTNQAGEEVTGIREAVLCPQCEHSDPAAAELIALFAVDEDLDMSNVETFAELAAAWVETAQSRAVDLDQLSEEEERWRRGEL